MYYPVRSMEDKLRPHYASAMRYAVELMEADQITSTFLKHI